MCTSACTVTKAGDVPINVGIVPIWLYHNDNPYDNESTPFLIMLVVEGLSRKSH